MLFTGAPVSARPLNKLQSVSLKTNTSQVRMPRVAAVQMKASGARPIRNQSFRF